MARHLCFERAYLDQLLAAGVLERDADGKFDLNSNRRRYILHLRELRRRSPKSEADAEFQRSKSELIQIRIAEKKRQLIMADEAFEMIDEMAGLFLTAFSGLPARIAGRDLSMRRQIEKVIFAMRTELAEAATKLANEHREPPLSEQGPEVRPT